jgi:hypothetical protein
MAKSCEDRLAHEVSSRLVVAQKDLAFIAISLRNERCTRPCHRANELTIRLGGARGCEGAVARFREIVTCGVAGLERPHLTRPTASQRLETERTIGPCLSGCLT